MITFSVGRHLVFPLALVTALVAASTAGSDVTRCSVSSVPVLQAPDLTHLIGIGVADARSGGFVEGFQPYGPMGGLLTPSDTFWGQLVEVERIGGYGAEAILSTNRRPVVVLVPWGYGPDCRIMRWTSGVRWWCPVGQRGLVWARLRARADWMGDLPTLDVLRAQHQPYPHGPSIRYDRLFPRGDPSSILQVDQLWALYETLPTLQELRADTVNALGRLRAWQQAHPEQARLFPATRILTDLPYVARNP